MPLFKYQKYKLVLNHMLNSSLFDIAFRHCQSNDGVSYMQFCWNVIVVTIFEYISRVRMRTHNCFFAVNNHIYILLLLNLISQVLTWYPLMSF